MEETIIETDRLILRKFRLTDCEDVFEFGSDEEIQRYTGDELIPSVDAARKRIQDGLFVDYQKYGYGRLACIYKPDEKLIGFAGLKYLPELDETDIGFRFLQRYWGRGIATEASKELIKYGFEELGLNRIIGIAMEENIASQKVLTKIGLRQYKIGEYDGDGGEHRWYKIDAKDYQTL